MSLLRRRILLQKTNSDGFNGFEYVYDSSKQDILVDEDGWAFTRGNYSASYEEDTEDAENPGKGFHLHVGHGYGGPRITFPNHNKDWNNSIELELSYYNTNAVITLLDEVYAVQVSFSRFGNRKLLLFPSDSNGNGISLTSLAVTNEQDPTDVYYKIKLVKKWPPFEEQEVTGEEESDKKAPHYWIYFNDDPIPIKKGICQASTGLKTSISKNNLVNTIHAQGAGVWTASSKGDIYIKKLVYRSW